MTTTEQLMKAKPPADVIAELKEFEASMKIPFATIKTEFYNILIQPYLSQFENTDDRCRQASKILLAQFADKLSYQTAEMEFKIIDFTSIKTKTKEVEKEDPITHQMITAIEERHMAKIFGIFAGTGDDNAYTTKLGIVTCWDDACQVLQNIERDGTYTGKFGIKEFDSFYALSLNDFIEFEPTKLDIPPIRDMITNFFTPVSVSEAEYNMTDGFNDYRLVKGRIQSSKIALSKKGNNLGYITLIDDNATIQEIKSEQASKLSIMFNDSPEFATRFSTGSEIYVLVQLSTSEQYGISAFGQLVIPIIGIPGNSTLSATKPIPAQQPATQNAIPSETPVQQPIIPTEGIPEGNASISESNPTPETKTEIPKPEEIAGW